MVVPSPDWVVSTVVAGSCPVMDITPRRPWKRTHPDSENMPDSRERSGDMVRSMPRDMGKGILPSWKLFW